LPRPAGRRHELGPIDGERDHGEGRQNHPDSNLQKNFSQKIQNKLKKKKKERLSWYCHFLGSRWGMADWPGCLIDDFCLNI
jgi:hypothetical protein